MGKSSCSSLAPRRSKSSKTWLMTQLGRAPGLSILFTTRMGRRPWSKAFWVTKRVWGMGPSWASTSNRTESTMDKTRSTSPPKSAWPGVSTMLMRYSIPLRVRRRAVFLARMVMPRSRSRSLESMTRSTGPKRSPRVPDCWSSLSTRVVLPWSTWAMMAMLRSFSITVGRLSGGMTGAGPGAEGGSGLGAGAWAEGGRSITEALFGRGLVTR